MASDGLAAATGTDPRQRRAGLMNMFTYGRSVTLAMQRMKSVDPAFDAWWKPYQDRMAKDPLMKYFNERRVDVIHAGELATTSYTRIGYLDDAILRELNEHAPPNTVSTFFGDQYGGNGWEVQLPDGTTEKVYFDLPGDVDVESGLSLPDPPSEHGGSPISDSSISNLGSLYVEALRTMVEEFEGRFKE